MTQNDTAREQTDAKGADITVVEGTAEIVEAEAEGTDIDLSGDDEDVDSEDSLTFSNGVIEKIVAIAMREVPGVVGMKGSWFNRVQDAFGASDSTKGVTVEVTPESAVRVNISVLIEYGAYAPQVFEDVKRAVVKQVSGMTGLEVAGVNLRIEDVLTPEEIEQRSRRAAGAARDDRPARERDERAEKDEDSRTSCGVASPEAKATSASTLLRTMPSTSSAV